MKKFHLPFKLIISNHLNWAEVDFLYKNNWISFSDLLEYASWKLQSKPGSNIESKIVELLISPIDEAKEIWGKIFSNLENENLSIDKILVTFFSWLKEQEFTIEKNLDIIESIYCDLNHVAELSMFIRYMPEDNKYRGSIKNNSELKERISHYLSIKDEQSNTGIPFNEIEWIH